MLYYNFYGYEEFKARFGLEKRDNGDVYNRQYGYFIQKTEAPFIELENGQCKFCLLYTSFWQESV